MPRENHRPVASHWTSLYSEYLLPSTVKAWNDLPLPTRNLESLNSFKYLINTKNTKVPAHQYVGCRLGQILDARLRINCSALNAHLLIRNLVESPNCICGITETVSHFLLDCPRHTTIRQQLFFSLLYIAETISLNLFIFGSFNLNNEENKAAFKSVHTFIIKSKRFTPWHAYIILFTFLILFNLFVLLFSSKLCCFQLHATYIFFSPSMYK